MSLICLSGDVFLLFSIKQTVRFCQRKFILLSSRDLIYIFMFCEGGNKIQAILPISIFAYIFIIIIIIVVRCEE